MLENLQDLGDSMIDSDMRDPMNMGSMNMFPFVNKDNKPTKKRKRKNGYQRQMKRAQSKVKRGMIQL
jgi:hypothetical protein